MRLSALKKKKGVTQSPDALFGHVHSFVLTKSICAVKKEEITVKFDFSAPCGFSGNLRLEITRLFSLQSFYHGQTC